MYTGCNAGFDPADNVIEHLFEFLRKLQNAEGTPLVISEISLKIRQSTIYYAGLLGRWDKRIVDQESDVPSIIFFIDSKLFIFIFVIL